MKHISYGKIVIHRLHLLILTILFFITEFCVAQATFEQGYIVDTSGRRIDCRIQIPKWNGTPVEFFYKTDDSAGIRHVTPEGVKEFGLNGSSRYISAAVNIDISSDNEDNPSDMKDPDWSGQSIFLLILVEGDASLYYYDQPSIRRFFYSVSGSPLRQLVYKKYRTSAEHPDEVETNALFRQQLWSDMRNELYALQKVENLEYTKRDLTGYVIDYNKVKGNDYYVNSKKKEYPVFNMKFTPGVNYSKVHVKNTYYEGQNFDYDGKFGFRCGLESELIFPYTYQKVSLVLEPSYQYFSGSETSFDQEFSVRLHFIEFPIGVRYYIHFNKNLKGFLNVFYVPGICVSLNSNFVFDGVEYPVNLGHNIAAGAGISWKQWGLEFRWYSNKNIIGGSDYLVSKYSRISVIASYRLFKTRQYPDLKR